MNSNQPSPSKFGVVPLTRGKYAWVDIEDLDEIMQLKWQARSSKGNWYAIHSTTTGEIPMHVFILGKRSGYEVDHIDQNGLDNRRKNLRFSTKSQNRANVALRKDSKSGYKGVSFNTKLGKWVAYINENKKRNHLGYFKSKEEAAVRYNKVANELFGEFAWLNQIH